MYLIQLTYRQHANTCTEVHVTGASEVSGATPGLVEVSDATCLLYVGT